MNQHLEFNLSWEQLNTGEDAERATYASLALLADGQTVTRVEDQLAKTTRSVVRVAAYPLALWFASNWWRLRWEGPRKRGGDHDWVMSHRLSAAGGGYVWPDLEIVSHGEYVSLCSQETSSNNVDSITYLGNVDVSLPADEFVAALDGFIDSVIARLRVREVEETPLQELWTLVRKERTEPSISEFRRLEALLGFDAEEGPHLQIEALIEAGKRLGREAVAEVAATSTEVPDLGAIEEALREADRVAVQNCASLREYVAGTSDYRYSWQRGEEAGRIVRNEIGRPQGPLDDSILEEWLSLPANVLQDPSATRNVPFAAALRENADSEEMRVLFRSSFHSGRRFEIARLLGDHLVSAPRGDRMMPATQAKTARQSTQRAFAAELLLPWKDLVEQIGDDPDDDERIEDIAVEYQVSPLLVRTRLVSKGLSNHSL